MERREDVRVKDGKQYDTNFPNAYGDTELQKKSATVSDTIRFIPKVVNETLSHTKAIAGVLKGNTLTQTCKNIWDFVYTYIAYKKDDQGKEQVRSPARTWRDRKTGVDCDCYTVFISSILTNLKIKHKLRITKYAEDHFQHIYPIVPSGNADYITIDCVVKKFNYEEPFTEKNDTNMDLEYLNGVQGPQNMTDSLYSQDLMGAMDEQQALSELGKIIKRKTNSGGGSSTKKQKFKQAINKGLHNTNKFNPATLAIRNGVLVAMKINFLGIAHELKYTYLDDRSAQKKGLVMSRFPKMKQVREKLEKIFYAAGGKPENFKKAILTGKGNRNKEVPLHGLYGVAFGDVEGLNDEMSVSQLLGKDMYISENNLSFGMLGELGEPTTAASLAAATTVLTAIAGLIKDVGSLMPKKNKASKGDKLEKEGNNSSSENSGNEVSENTSFSSGANDNTQPSYDNTTDSSGSGSENTNVSSEDTSSSTLSSSTKTNLPATSNNSSSPEQTFDNKEEENNDKTNTSGQKVKSGSVSGSVGTTAKTKLFWENNKKWIKPTGIALGTLALIAFTYKVLKPKAQRPMAGLPKSKKKLVVKTHKKTIPFLKSRKKKKKMPIELL